MANGVDIATLGLAIDAKGLPEGIERLVALERAGVKVEASFKGVERATRSAAEASTRRNAALATEATGLERLKRQNEAAAAAHRNFLENRKASEARAASELAAQAAQTGRQQARAQIEAYEARFRADIARIKEGQARGFISAKEAAEAGREAAEAYNRSVIQTIDEGSKAGAFRGAAGNEAFTDVAGSLKNVQEASRGAGLGLGRLNQSMASLITRATGADPVVGRLTSTVGSFAVGSAFMVPVLAGVAALGLAWRHYTEDAREARKETKDLTAEMIESARIRALGDAGKELDDVRKLAEAQRQANEEALEAQNQLQRRRASGAGPATLDAGADAVARAQERAKDAATALTEAQNRLRDAQIRVNEEFRREQESQRRATETREQARITAEASIAAQESEIEKLTALNAAHGESEKALKLLGLQYDEQAQLRQNAIRLTGEELEIQNRLTRERFAALRAGAENEAAENEAEAQRKATEAIEKKLVAMRREVEEAERMLAARKEGQEAVDALVIALAGERAVIGLSAEEMAKYGENLRAAAEKKARLDIETRKLVEAEREAEKAARAEAKAREEARKEMERYGRAVIDAGQALGILDRNAASALNSAVNLASAIDDIVANGLSGGAVGAGIAAIANIGSALFGGDDKERERRELLAENNKRLDDVAKNLETFGGRLAGLDLREIMGLVRILQVADFEYTGPGIGAGGLPIGFDSRGSVEAQVATLTPAAEFFRIDPESLRDEDVRERVIKLLEEVFAEAREQVQRDVGGDFAARAATLAGDDQEAARIRREAAAARERQEIEKLGQAGFLDPEQVAEFIGIIDEELTRALEDAAEAAEREREATETNLQARLLSAQGRDEEAAALIREAQRKEELRQVTEEYGEEMAALLVEVHAAEEAARQAAEAEAALRAEREFSADLAIRRAELDGRNEDAIRLRHEIRTAQELEAAQKLLDAGTITQRQFNELADLLGDELAAALQAAADAAANLNREMAEDLEVRRLLATGQDEAAQKLRLQIQHQREYNEAVAAGISRDMLADLKEVQDLEMKALIKSFAEALKREEGPLSERERRTVNEVTRRDVTGITTFQAVGMLQVLHLQLAAERQQVALLSRIAGFNASPPSGLRMGGTVGMQSGGGGTNLNLTVNVQGGSDPQRTGEIVGDAIVNRLDSKFGDRLRRPMTTRSSSLS